MFYTLRSSIRESVQKVGQYWRECYLEGGQPLAITWQSSRERQSLPFGLWCIPLPASGVAKCSKLQWTILQCALPSSAVVGVALSWDLPSCHDSWELESFPGSSEIERGTTIIQELCIISGWKCRKLHWASLGPCWSKFQIDPQSQTKRKSLDGSQSQIKRKPQIDPNPIPWEGERA